MSRKEDRPSSPAQVASRPGPEVPRFPAVALVGRPNVGKSSLFNALLAKEVSITDKTAGTTRDRVLHPVVLNGKACDLVDTGGIGIVDRQDLSDLVENQILAGVQTAHVLVLVVDAKEGLTPPDQHIARRLRQMGRPVVVAANKSEGKEAGLTVGEFSALGFDVVGTSALHRIGLDELSEAIARQLPEAAKEEEDWDELPKLAMVGRRNVGKSSFLNTLAREERTIVSDVPGTTRDAVDLLLQKDSRRFWLIDTAGVRRRKEPEGPVEFFSQVRTERAVRRADVILFMLDAREGLSTTDLKTADLIREQFKPCIVVVNKWDLAPGAVTGEYAAYLEGRLPALRHAPICFTSAKEGSRCWQTLDVALELYDKASKEIPTPQLNAAIVRSEREHEPPVRKGRKPRLLYGVQVGVRPPTFVVHCRHAQVIDAKYKRFLGARLGELLGLDEVPLRLFLRETARKR